MKIKDKIDILLCKMANLFPENTGLPVVIWVQEKPSDKIEKNKHTLPRIKVMPKKGKANISQSVSVSIEDNPKVLNGKLSSTILNSVKKWILLNKISLLNHWNQEIDTVSLIHKLKKIT